MPRSLEDIFNAQPESTASDFDIDSRNLEAQIKSSQLARFRSDTWDRKWLAVWTACVVTLWLAAVMFALLANSRFFHLSETVLVALLGTTTLNVLGLSYIVLKGHFTASNS